LARTITGNREQSVLFAASDVDEAFPVRLKRIRLELTGRQAVLTRAEGGRLSAEIIGQN
jgi:hypothetical protein